MSKITVVDSIMGSGKTSWAIQYMNENPNNRVLYVTPFLDEVGRIINNVNREIYQPVNKGKGKLSSINELLTSLCDVAATHELFKHLNSDSKDAILLGNYTLILDEVLSVVEPYDEIKSGDLEILTKCGAIVVDNNGFVIWNNEFCDDNIVDQYKELKSLATNKSIMLINGKFLIWRYPPEIFQLFDDVYILTYLFEGSILKYYFDLNNISYEKKSINKINNEYLLCDYSKPDTSVYKKLINIYDGKMNDNCGVKFNALSVQWFDRQTPAVISQLKKNLVNYYINTLKAKSDSILWTTFKTAKKGLSGKGYTTAYIACNCRATNQYADKYNLAYCVNIYLHPAITNYFRGRNTEIREDLYALSEMIQWIWRSRIRHNEPINIYIPSKRMRNLLKQWLNNEIEI